MSEVVPCTLVTCTARPFNEPGHCTHEEVSQKGLRWPKLAQAQHNNPCKLDSVHERFRRKGHITCLTCLTRLPARQGWKPPEKSSKNIQLRKPKSMLRLAFRSSQLRSNSRMAYVLQTSCIQPRCFDKRMIVNIETIVWILCT